MHNPTDPLTVVNVSTQEKFCGSLASTGYSITSEQVSETDFLKLLETAPDSIEKINWGKCLAGEKNNTLCADDFISIVKNIANKKKSFHQASVQLHVLSSKDKQSNDILLSLQARKLSCLQRMVDGYHRLEKIFFNNSDLTRANYCYGRANAYQALAYHLLEGKLTSQMPNASNDEVQLLKRRTVQELKEYLENAAKQNFSLFDNERQAIISLRAQQENLDVCLSRIQQLLQAQIYHYKKSLNALYEKRDNLYQKKKPNFGKEFFELNGVEELCLLNENYRHIKAKLIYVQQLSKRQRAIRNLFHSIAVLGEKCRLHANEFGIEVELPNAHIGLTLAIEYLSDDTKTIEKKVYIYLLKILDQLREKHLGLSARDDMP